MTLKEVGGIFQIESSDDSLLSHDWHLQLTDAQLAAYVRYQFVRLKEYVIDWDSSAHTQVRTKWDGGKDGNGVSHKSVWPKVLRVIRDTNAHPGAWIAARFSGVASAITARAGTANPPIRPPALYDYNATTIYAEYCKRFNKTFTFNFNVAVGVIATRSKEMSAYNLADDNLNFYVLCDEAYVTASPFLRHGFASAVGCKRAALKYLWQAAIDYEAQQSLYDAAVIQQGVEHFVSEELKTTVGNIRKHWVTYHG